MHRETKHYLMLTHNEPSVTFGWVIGTFFFALLKTHKAESLHILTSTTQRTLLKHHMSFKSAEVNPN